MIEPWVSTLSRPIYTRLHHEPFNPDAKDWSFPDTGPLSGANGALPWIIFQRDRHHFESGSASLEFGKCGLSCRFGISSPGEFRCAS
jgi:hypothetical protein